MPPLTLRGQYARRSSMLFTCQSVLGCTGLQPRRSFASRAKTRANDGEGKKADQKTIIKHFAETGTGDNRKRRRIDPEKDELEVNAEAEKLKAKIGQLEGELRRLREGPIISQLSGEDRDRLEKAIGERLANVAHQGSPIDTEQMTTELVSGARSKGNSRAIRIDSGPLPRKEQLYLDKFNGFLGEAASKPADPNTRKELWRWYSLCKQNLPPFLHLIPQKAWNVLYDSQNWLSVSNPDRQAHIKAILEDMAATGHEIKGDQKIAYIEALFLEGEKEEAISEWEGGIKTIGVLDEFSEQFWGLGVKMFASIGDPQRAQNTAHILLSSRHGGDARIWLPVIIAWNKTGEESGFLSAWSLYVRLKDRLGPRMSMEDYDTITMSFLNAGKKDLALAAFRDMMLAGSSSEGEDSISFYKRSLNLVANLQSTSPDPSELSNVSLQALTVLPRRFQNKFFYGSWMKKLLGMGEVDSAVMVVELMYERGVNPDARHLNGIIGAWLRTGRAESRKKAEDMAWGMIQERLDFVQKRHASGSPTSGAPSIGAGGHRELPNFLRRRVPPATIETFSILVQYYLRRSKFDEVEKLSGHLQMAEIKPNSYFMNHLLYSLLRNHDRQAAWQMYTNMTREGGVKPDISTFTCLWDCMKIHVDILKNRKKEGFPQPRRLFREMVTWYSKWSAREYDEVSKELYDQIIRCFSLIEDQVGTLVALHALRDMFGMHPDKDTVRIIVLQIARLGTLNVRSRRLNLSDSNTKASFARVMSVLEKLTQQRHEILEKEGGQPDEKDLKVEAEESLWLVSELLRIVIARGGRAAEAAEDIRKAASEMGVEGGESVSKYLDSIV
ncbi:hypothetical protein FGG08_001403 [Glutinoglossum americanum]|uniref:Pentatricopeptide repeat protein n=1 Tax=Glutinoglossum americanum TaxID=1670608 RepID=A0A9P8I714_9PEZI|nr:hypothetical protein FGG08_001403 [Glutinoglossum americanum]